jgi:membrane dipeptidase
MKRRDFIRNVAVVGAAASVANVVEARLPELTAPSLTQGKADHDGAMAIERSTIVVNGLDPSVLTEKYLGMLKTGGVNCWNYSAGDLASFAEAYHYTDKYSDRIAPAMSVRDIEQIHQQGKIALLLSWQDAGDLNGDVSLLRAYHQLGLRISGIAYNVAGFFGAGCLEPTIGLTRAGHRLVEEVHKLRIVLDVGGHTGEQTSFDAIQMSSGVPIICTHTNVLALNDNPRCMSDKLIEAIAKTGGVIGITAFSDFHVRTRRDANVAHTPQAGLEKHLDQYDYVKKLVGADHVGLGPDFIEGKADSLIIDRNVMAAEAYSDLPWFYVKGFESIAELPNVTQGLVQRGWSNGDIRKVLGENWLRVYKQVWGA